MGGKPNDITQPQTMGNLASSAAQQSSRRGAGLSMMDNFSNFGGGDETTEQGISSAGASIGRGLAQRGALSALTAKNNAAVADVASPQKKATMLNIMSMLRPTVRG